MISNRRYPNLPYNDEKPQGAADFYFAINATFRFIRDKLGPHALRDYWIEMGRSYFLPVTHAWQAGGLAAVANYWRDFYSAEPGADVEVVENDGNVILHVRQCPAIFHLRENGRQIVSDYCQHCYFVSEAMAQPAGLKVRVQGGDGECKQIFSARSPGDEPQDINEIRRATS